MGDGLQYPVQSQHLVRTYESMGDTSTRLEENIKIVSSNNLDKISNQTLSTDTNAAIINIVDDVWLVFMFFLFFFLNPFCFD